MTLVWIDARLSNKTTKVSSNQDFELDIPSFGQYFYPLQSLSPHFQYSNNLINVFCHQNNFNGLDQNLIIK